MSQSLREGGEAILKFYIRRAYKLCPAIWERSSAGEQYIICIMTSLVQIQPFPPMPERVNFIDMSYTGKAPSRFGGAFSCLTK